MDGNLVAFEFYMIGSNESNNVYYKSVAQKQGIWVNNWVQSEFPFSEPTQKQVLLLTKNPFEWPK